MKIDVLAKAEAAAASGDEKLQAAWEAASQFKKRYMEHKGELDTIRLAAARMQVRWHALHQVACKSLLKLWVLCCCSNQHQLGLRASVVWAQLLFEFPPAGPAG